jgi:hypothetical protein
LSKQGKIMGKRYKPGEIVPENGIYRVMHDSHRLMHAATLLKGDRFPLCRECKDGVRFEMRRNIQNPTRSSFGNHSILEEYPDTESLSVN